MEIFNYLTIHSIHHKHLTMKHLNTIFTFLVLFCFAISTQAQETYRQTIDFNNEWYILYTEGTGPIEQEIRVYSFNETPVELNGTSYFMLEYYELENPGQMISDPTRLFREEEGKIWGLDGFEEFLLADFTLDVGEMLVRDESAPFYSQIIADKEMVTLLDGSERIRMEYCCQIDGMTECDPALSEYNYFTTEGFIDPSNLLKSPCHIWDNQAYSNELLCYYENGVQVFKGDGVEDCLTIVSSNEKASEVTSFTVYPNPVNQTLQLNLESNTEMNVEIWTTDGRMVESRKSNDKFLNVQHLQPGYYLIKINTDRKQFISRFVKN